MSIDFNKVPRYITNEIDPPAKIIAKGTKNKTVKRIQEWLNYHHCRTGIDGDYGPATEACVEDFQSMKRLKKTGKVDKTTWNALVKPMRDALTAPRGIKSMSDSEAVLAVANQHVEQHPFEIGKPNGGPWVRLYCEGHDGPPWAWCAGFVTMILQQAYFYRNLKAPIKGSVSCDTLAAQAKRAGLFVAEREITSGRRKWSEMGHCCIFLRRRTSTDWTHTGFAVEGSGGPKELVFTTIEGNTNDEGSREGFEACRRKRGVSGSNYDFIVFNK
jgi:hypothetical protein